MSWCVSGYGVFWHGWLKIALNILFQLCDVQSGFDRTSRSISAGGITEGWEFACGNIVEKSCRDKASAIWLEEPGKWTAEWASYCELQWRISSIIGPLILALYLCLSWWKSPQPHCHSGMHKINLPFPCMSPYTGRKNDWQQLFCCDAIGKGVFWPLVPEPIGIPVCIAAPWAQCIWSEGNVRVCLPLTLHHW